MNNTISIPGSKSYTNRSLLLATMSNHPVIIKNPLISDDTKAMVTCLKKLGIKTIEKKNAFAVINNIQSVKNLSYNLNVNESGITLRFLLALSTIIPGIKTLYGKEGLNKRPVADLVEALKQLGANIKYLDKAGYPPVQVLSSKLNPGTVTIKGSTSSQYISALLMIAPLIGEVLIKVTGDQISKPYIDMTIDTMKKFGVTVKNNHYKKYFIPANQKYNAKEYPVEGDLSSAGYFLAIAALTKSTLTLENINPNSKQADMKFVKILTKMGNKISFGKNNITITGTEVKPISVNMQDCPDQIQTLAVLAAFAKGITRISGISSLRIKETDRVFALQAELKKMGITTSATKNVLTIHGGNPKAAKINTYGDHRMAMAFAVARTKIPGMQINNPEVVSKTFPDFWKKLNSWERNIVLIGMRGSGKTTVGKILAKKLQMDFMETDQLIAKKADLTISEIVQKYGWDKFRQLEQQIIQDIAGIKHSIISTGGGVVLNKRNIELLKKSGMIFYLRCQIPTLVKRAGHNSSRPPLTDKKTVEEEITAVLKQRAKLYEKAADEIINVDELTSRKTANLIMAKLKKLEVCMVIGDPIKHTLSPAMHNAGYKALGIDNRFVYIAERITKENLKSVLETAKASDIRGISVTVPHKQSVIKHLDSIDPVAKKIGAVNTIINDHGKLTGFNTDWIGATTALKKKVALKGKKTAVIGAGGAARAIVYGLKKNGAIVKIFNRSQERAKKLTQEFNCDFSKSNSLKELSNMDIIINASSVGMNEDESPIDKKLINKNHIVFDIVYSPKETRLITDAKEKGAKVILGYEMLLFQGMAQFQLFTGRKAPEKIMRKVLEDSL